MSKKTKTVIFSGGLGNQLFQFAFLHNLSRESNETVNLYFPVQNDDARPFNLHRLVEQCSHLGNIQLTRSRKIDFLLNLGDFINHRLPRLKLSYFRFTASREKNAYEYSQLKTNHEMFSGYFQNWNYVSSVIDVISIELKLVLDEILSEIPIDLPISDYGVLHFRRGDLLQYSNSMGVLEVDYFRQAVERAQSADGKKARLVVISDDPVLATEVFAISSFDIYGPEELSEWEALAVMSRAKFVITSNSTFSWWGGLLATRNGGTAYIPDPWFLNWDPEPSDAFQYPGFKVLPSIFAKEPVGVDIEL